MNENNAMLKDVLSDLITNLNCEQLTTYLKMVGVFGDDDLVSTFDYQKIATEMEKGRNYGYDVYVNIEGGNDEYFVVNYDEEQPSCVIYGLADDNDQFRELCKIDNVELHTSKEAIEYLIGIAKNSGGLSEGSIYGNIEDVSREELISFSPYFEPLANIITPTKKEEPNVEEGVDLVKEIFKLIGLVVKEIDNQLSK